MTTYTVIIGSLGTVCTVAAATQEQEASAQVQALEVYIDYVRQAHMRGMVVTGQSVALHRDAVPLLECPAHDETGNGPMP